MRMKTDPPIPSAEQRHPMLEWLRCIACGVGLQGQGSCPNCGRTYPQRDGLLEAIGLLTGRNQVVAAFYDGPGWPKFRPWERAFLWLQGGPRHARLQILRHVLALNRAEANVLEVGIGDGENLPYLPEGWDFHGVDISRVQLASALRRFPKLAGRLAWAEGEALPFPDNTFDATWTIGGFTFFRDHAEALREMRRVTRPGGPVVVADEIPGLQRAGLGHLIGWKAYDAWWLRRLGLDRDFVEMVLDHELDVEALRREVWPESTRHRIWNGLGYCIVHPG